MPAAPIPAQPAPAASPGKGFFSRMGLSQLPGMATGAPGAPGAAPASGASPVGATDTVSLSSSTPDPDLGIRSEFTFEDASEEAGLGDYGGQDTFTSSQDTPEIWDSGPADTYQPAADVPASE